MGLSWEIHPSAEESECWMFNTIPTARVIFTAKKQVCTNSVLDENRFGLFQSWMIESMR